MVFLELSNFFRCPRVEAGGCCLEPLDIARRVDLDIVLPNTELEYLPDRLDAVVSACGVSILRSRRTSTASSVNRLNGMSRKNFEEPGAIGSSKVLSSIRRWTRCVPFSVRL